MTAPAGTAALARPAGVFCDMDGLLLDSEVVYRQAWTAAAAAQGHVLTVAAYAALVGNGIGNGERTVAAHAGPGFALAAFQAGWRAQWRRLVTDHGVPAKPGALALLDGAAARGIPLALVTSSHRAETMLVLGPLARRFATIVTGDDVARGKPAPDIYLAAAARLGVAPGSGLALEDSPAGVLSAHAAGIPVIQVPDLTGITPASRDAASRVCASLTEVMGLLGW
jgi:HAD superfamily hydrolase (TIGR01509 family)